MVSGDGSDQGRWGCVAWTRGRQAFRVQRVTNALRHKGLSSPPPQTGPDGAGQIV
jgi:hypothetical protein